MELAIWILIIVVIWASVVVAHRLRDIHTTLRGIWQTLYQLEERIREKDEEREQEKRREEFHNLNQP